MFSLQNSSVKCSAGHDSTEADFCSVCGVEIEVAGGPVVPPANLPVASSSPSASTSAAHEHCPKCQAEREDPSSPFCGTCGYNFVTKLGGDVAAVEPVKVAPVAPVVSASVAPAASAASAAQASGAARMDISVAVDFGKPGAPAVRPSATFPLFDEENLIGRKGSSYKQTVAIEDQAVSGRHLLIVRNADRSYVVRDINSTNGTKVNGVDLKSGVDHALKVGDVIAIGEFTLITVLSIR
jgi:hypothetical protein